MKVTLSLETSISADTSIMVDALRASTTMISALNKYEKVIPCFTPEEGFKLKDKNGGVLAGERGGEKIEGFDIGNSPTGLKDYDSDERILILTTSNGTRILENMTSQVLIGSLINAKAVGEASTKMAESHIDVVMAGVKGEFTLEDFLAAGEILYWICESLEEYELNDFAKAAINANRDDESLKEGFYNSRSGKRLAKIGYEKDIEYCIQKNITSNVAIYKNGNIVLL